MLLRLKKVLRIFSRSRDIAFTFDILINGNPITKKTKYIFSKHAIFKLDANKYYLEKVLIAYGKQKDDVIVIGIKNK